MSGKLIISLDFELMWGVRDHRTVAEYGDAVLGVRDAIPAMLSRFERSGIRATWATVGLLFARNRDEVLDHMPSDQPSYANSALSPYGFISDGLGKDEESDPHHFGATLVDQIAQTEGQEIACHTFSHYFCLEPGQSLEQFEADLKAAGSIAEARGIKRRSLVFPRNQWTSDHVAIAHKAGLQTFRGDPPGIMYRSRSGSENTLWVRGLRLADGVAPVAKRNDYSECQAVSGMRNVIASRFLRTTSGPGGSYAKLHQRRILKEMKKAARDGRNYHLWWHPHNFGRNTEASLSRLDGLLDGFKRLQDEYGMQSWSMADFSESDTVPGHAIGRAS